MKSFPYSEEIFYATKLLLLFASAGASLWVSKRFLARILNRLVERSQTRFEDLLIKHRLFEALSYLVPISILYYGSSFFPFFEKALKRISLVALSFVLALAIDRGLSILLDAYNRTPLSKKHPIRGYIQVAKVILWIAAVIVAICVALDRSPWGILSGLGALSAVLILVFRNTLLSFVASLQIVGQDLIRIGDWIEAPQFGADGEVVEITLYNVLVQNWDKTIVSIPTYRLMEESFKNWRGMQEAKGRRIKRHLLIDQSSVKFCDEDLLLRLERNDLTRPYLEETIKNLRASNGDSVTNLSLFRLYAEEYLRRHPFIRKDLTLMVRHLQPTAYGIPLELYCFVSDTRWVPYEKIQADIFDHLIAVIPEFDLKLFQSPSTYDLKSLSLKSF